ncbi:MAG: EAL domain-containing protein [Gammaproteobacteria bacterium]|nr:EAL domain-containing protein [Gammaproteobacteria bacterium]
MTDRTPGKLTLASENGKKNKHSSNDSSRAEVANTVQKSSAIIISALYQIASQATLAKDMEQFFTKTHEIVATLTHAENFFIALYNEGEDTINFPYIVDSASEFDVNSLAKLPLETLNKTLTGYMLRTGKMLHANSELMDALEAQGEINNLGENSCEWLGFPLKNADSIIGAMVVQSYNPEIIYKANDIELLQYVSQHIAIALSNKQSNKALKKTKQDLENRVFERSAELAETNRELGQEIKERHHAEKLNKSLFYISELANSNIEQDQFFQEIHLRVAELIYAENFYIALLDKTSKSISFPYFVDKYSDSQSSRKLHNELQEWLTENVLDAGVALLIDNNSLKKHLPKRTLTIPENLSWIGVPLKDEKEATIGVLTVQSYDPDILYCDSDKDLLGYVAQHISTSLQRHKSQKAIYQAHRELQLANDQLEQRVIERTKKLQESNAILKENIEDRKLIENKLAHDAFHDSLTHLPNRPLFLNRLGHAIDKLQRDPDAHFAVLFLDLDRFKIINDSLGHHIGDLLLKEISKRILKCIRPGDTLARLGGDEFAILLVDLNISTAANIVTDRISSHLEPPFELDEQVVFTSASIGINLCTEIDKTADDILRDADTAMYHAKSKGKAQHAVFDNSMYKKAVMRLRLESELRRALDKDQISVFYQPIVDLENNRTIAFEALARWLHPEMGWISPIDFIPIAEETGLILDLGLYILDEGLKQARVWQQQDHQLENLMVSINLSTMQLSQPDLLKDIMQIIQANDYLLELLRFEVTESILIDNFEVAKNVLHQFSKAGIKILLDDFGTGYSSLSYLHHFPIDVLKVDRSFVSQMENRDENMTIISTIKALASSLNMEVVGEGIETSKQYSILKSMDFEYGQGYYFSRPMPANEVDLYLQQKILQK